MTYLITGATGLVGAEIVSLCRKNDITIHYLTTSKKKIENTPNYKGFYWNPSSGEIDRNAFNGVTKIINLAGANVAERWTTSYKKEILESRIITASLLHKTLSEIKHSVTHFISASAIGIYPDSLTKVYTEESLKEAANFLGTVVKAWEQAADSFTSLKIKVAKVRIGIVLSDKGGALPKLIAPLKLYAGAAFASGKQWQSWIHIYDLAAVFYYVAKNNLEGIYNGVAPNAVSQKKLLKISAKNLDKPLVLPNIPAFVAKLLLGEMHVILVEGQRVSSNKIIKEGYNFKFPTIETAIEDLLES